MLNESKTFYYYKHAFGSRNENVFEVPSYNCSFIHHKNDKCAERSTDLGKLNFPIVVWF